MIRPDRSQHHGGDANQLFKFSKISLFKYRFPERGIRKCGTVGGSNRDFTVYMFATCVEQSTRMTCFTCVFRCGNSLVYRNSCYHFTATMVNWAGAQIKEIGVAWVVHGGYSLGK